MKKKQSEPGITSCVLALVPFLGVFAYSWALDPENELILKISAAVIVYLALLASPVAGLILGIKSLIQNPKRLVLPIIGTISNLGWVTFVVWIYINIKMF